MYSFRLAPGNALATLEFTWIFNDYLWALTLVQQDNLKPVTTGLASLRGEYIQAFNIRFAGTLIAVIPTVLLFMLLQRYFIQGLTMGSGKRAGTRASSRSEETVSKDSALSRSVIPHFVRDHDYGGADSPDGGRYRMATQHTDVVIVGGGTMGTAAGWALARQGARVVVLEQFQHVHAYGSHGGRTRIFRHAYAEGPRYVPWALEADRLWSALQERTGARFMRRIGCLDISGPANDRAHTARASAIEYGIAHEWLTGPEINRRWPIWRLPEDRVACYGPDAGFLDVAVALKSLAGEMTAAGGVLHEQTPVRSWSATDSGVRVETGEDTYIGERLILTAGAWSVHLLAELGVPLEVRRKPVLWFEVDEEHQPLVQPEWMPVFIVDDAHGEFYGIPQHETPGVKIGMHSGGDVVAPNAVDRAVVERDYVPTVVPFIERNLRGFTGTVLDTSMCMYTMSPDEDFVIDRHPEHDRVVFATGFSGHGFKFAPVIGEYLASLSAANQVPVRSDFAVSRFAAVSP